MMNKQKILDELHAGITTVSFIKVNGERRDMRCSLNEDILPPREDENVKQTRKENPDVQSVWDVDAKGWRSFRWENVIDEDQNMSKYSYTTVDEVSSEHRTLIEEAAGLPIEEIDIEYINEFLNVFLEDK